MLPLSTRQVAMAAVSAISVSGLCLSAGVAVVSMYPNGVESEVVAGRTILEPDTNRAGGHVRIAKIADWAPAKETTRVDAITPGEDASVSNDATSSGESGPNDIPETVPPAPSSGDATNSPGSTSDAASNANATAQQDSSTSEGSQSDATQQQDSGYDYALDVPGYCGGGWDCAQAAVNSMSLSYVYYAPNFSIIAGHNYGPAGVIANFRPGTVVKVTGNGAGLYRVTHTHWMQYTTDYQQVHGAFAFQTCVGDQILHAYAERIG